MKLQLIGHIAQEKKKTRLKPVDHFKKCPACGSNELIEVNPDVLCSHCDWNSTAWDVSRGGMDNLYSAAKEFGFRIMESIDGGKQPSIGQKIENPKTNIQGA